MTCRSDIFPHELVSGARLTALRCNAGWSLEELATRAAIHPGALKRWERGAYALRPEILNALALVFKVSPDVLLCSRDAKGRPVIEYARANPPRLCPKAVLFPTKEAPFG